MMRPSSSPSDGPSEGSGGDLFGPVLARGRVRELVADLAWLQAMLDAEAALARAEAAVGLMPAAHADAITAACRAERFDPAAIGAASVAAGNPVVPLVRALTEEVRRCAGEDEAGWVHVGATSQDILDTATMLIARSALAAVELDLRDAAAATADLARDHARTPMAGRTLLQQALPTTFGLKAAGWLTALDDAGDAVQDAADRLPAQLGGAAGTLASLGDRGTDVVAAFARQLGLAEPMLPWHTARLPVARVAAALGAAAGVVDKVAGDVVLMAQTEVDELRESVPGRGGSSTMPHKHNPVAAIAARAGARQAPGLVGTLLAAMGHEHERAAGSWHAEWAPLRHLFTATGAAAAWLRDCLTGLEIDTGRMRANLDATGGQLLAERVTTALQPALGRLAAYDLVEDVTRRAVEDGRSLLDALVAAADVRAHLSQDQLNELLDPTTYLGRAETFVARALARHEERR